MMRKNIKTGLVAFGMCLALPFCSFAAVKNPEKAEGREERAQIRTELASYREVLDSNTKELSDLISEKKALIDEVRKLRKNTRQMVEAAVKLLICQKPLRA